jgi:hypothetical protein
MVDKKKQDATAFIAVVLGIQLGHWQNERNGWTYGVRTPGSGSLEPSDVATFVAASTCKIVIGACNSFPSLPLGWEDTHSSPTGEQELARFSYGG